MTEELDFLLHVWWNEKLHNYSGRVWQFYIIIRTLSYALVISLLGIYLREIRIYSHMKTGTWVFIAVLFVITQNWKQSKYLSSEWTRKL